MKSMRILGLTIVVVFAFTAIAASAASAAEPAFYECAKVAGGKFEKGCTKEAGVGGKGGFEVKEGIGKKGALKGKSGKAELSTPGIGNVSCTSSTNVGTVTSPTHISKIVTTYKGCTSNGKKCASAGQKAGTIKTNSLEGDLGYISKANHEVGVDIKPEGNPAGTLAEFECEGVGIKSFGSVVGRYAPVNKFSKESELIFKAPGGTQEVQNLEGQPKDTLESEFSVAPGTKFASGQEQTSKNKAEYLEVKA